ncbi:MAG: DUF305 domain-containing protein [Methanospirillum sp.]
MIDDHLRETDQMREWHRAWYGMDVPAGGTGMAREMQALARADPFDRAFIETMIPHHESGIEMARQVAPEADQAEIRELAAKIIDATAGLSERCGAGTGRGTAPRSRPRPRCRRYSPEVV